MEAVFVVIGGGIAGVSCIEGLSILYPEASVILISASPVIKAVTSIVALSRMLTEFNVDQKSYDYLYTVHPNLNILHDTVISIDTGNRTVVTKKLVTITYSKLCICSGAVPKLIAPNNEYVIGIRDTDSAKNLQNRLKSAKKIAIIGNGGIATEIVYEVTGKEIIWIIKDKHISAKFIDPGAAEFFQDSLKKDNIPQEASSNIYKRFVYNSSNTIDDGSFIPGAALGPDWHNNIKLSDDFVKEHNITVEYDAEVKQILSVKGDNNWPIRVDLTNGKFYECDFVISATGVIPSSRSFTLESGVNFDIASDNGIKVNWKMQTNIENIYAAGDVCTVDWEKSFHYIQMRLWTQARQMGMYAAKCMVSSIKNEPILQDFCFELFTHVTRFYGYKVVLIGLFNGQTLNNDYEIMLRVTKRKEYVKLIMRDGHLHGAVLIGDTGLEEMCENLILNQLDLTIYGDDLLNPNIDIEDYFD